MKLAFTEEILIRCSKQKPPLHNKTTMMTIMMRVMMTAMVTTTIITTSKKTISGGAHGGTCPFHFSPRSIF